MSQQYCEYDTMDMSFQSSEVSAYTHGPHSSDEDEEDMRGSASMSGLPSYVTLLNDSPQWLLNLRNLPETDSIILLTPVLPVSSDTVPNDPFEPLGRSLAERHARIRHIPYLMRNGITSTHLAFIKRGHIIVLVLVYPFQQEVADTLFAVSDGKPCLIVICGAEQDLWHHVPFPTAIQTVGHSPLVLEATAALMFGEVPDPRPSQPDSWSVELWNETTDLPFILALWEQNFGGQFSMDQETLRTLLDRPGYAKHYVVKDPASGAPIAFAATYLSYADREQQKLIASLAILLVERSWRGRGIGLGLHNHAVGQLQTTRGVVRLQLGSTFPRLLYGPPLNAQFDEQWLENRGWQLGQDAPGQGTIVRDLILDFEDWSNFQPAATDSHHYRECTPNDLSQVLDFVEIACRTQSKIGWFDQYSSIDSMHADDIVLCMEQDTIVATAITYTPQSSVSKVLPWAKLIGSEMGGVTCVCIYPSRAGIIEGLIGACVAKLQAEGMHRLFLDGVSSRSEGMKLHQSVFQEWARYKDVYIEQLNA